jgi:hypothetical protein
MPVCCPPTCIQGGIILSVLVHLSSHLGRGALRSNKAPKARGRILSKGHLHGGIQVVERKLETTKYREQEDAWWEQSGEDGQDGEVQDDESGVCTGPLHSYASGRAA